ncbi:MAG TPA: AgmX/PglI C-terminal domain-containing protein [Spongiibacteraceae bacterium]|jgi:outer membrane biosynthesis protein TonB|nr:AgmX/PglI C-terminal domain-containing protein [Spongiibacteraceae bacterium]HUH37380.1 AgmX/PglI C-terminal domain-containing protein [Spongiibacteraceae bacterium]
MNAFVWIVQEPALPWTAGSDEDRRFRRYVRNAIIAFAVMAVLVPLIPVPELEREELEKLPPQLARIVLEEKTLPVPKKVEPPKPEPLKPEPKPEVAKKPEPKPKPEPVVKPEPKVIPKVDKVAEARQKAAKSGLLQFQDELAAMRDDTALDKVANASLTRANAQAAQLDRAVITANNRKTSGGINTAKLSRDTGGVALSGRETTTVDAPAGTHIASKRSGTDDAQRSGRSDEAIRKVMDSNKGAVFSIYNRALRVDPALAGKFTVQLVIEPSGQVSAIKIIASELGSADLEQKLLARIRMIAFGAADVVRTTLNYSFEFLPY